MINGMLIQESFETGNLPDILGPYVIRTYKHLLSGTQPIHIAMVAFPEDMFAAIIFVVTKTIKRERYYAHFVDADRMYVVFPHECVTVQRDADEEGFRHCLQRAAAYNIPLEQVPIRLMFNFGHSD